jgi:hypothetical protein
VFSDSFFHGFAMHPFGGYFMTVHSAIKGSHVDGDPHSLDTEEAGKDEGKVDRGEFLVHSRAYPARYTGDDPQLKLQDGKTRCCLVCFCESNDVHVVSSRIELLYDENGCQRKCQPTQSIYSKYSGLYLHCFRFDT